MNRHEAIKAMMDGKILVNDIGECIYYYDRSNTENPFRMSTDNGVISYPIERFWETEEWHIKEEKENDPQAETCFDFFPIDTIWRRPPGRTSNIIEVGRPAVDKGRILNKDHYFRVIYKDGVYYFEPYFKEV